MYIIFHVFKNNESKVCTRFENRPLKEKLREILNINQNVGDFKLHN